MGKKKYIILIASLYALSPPREMLISEKEKEKKMSMLTESQTWKQVQRLSGPVLLILCIHSFHNHPNKFM